MATHFKNSQWAVTDYGLECINPKDEYLIEASRLTETTHRGYKGEFYEWPLQLACKGWVDVIAFIDIYPKALMHHKRGFDAGMLRRSCAEALLSELEMRQHDESRSDAGFSRLAFRRGPKLEIFESFRV